MDSIDYAGCIYRRLPPITSKALALLQFSGELALDASLGDKRNAREVASIYRRLEEGDGALIFLQLLCLAKDRGQALDALEDGREYADELLRPYGLSVADIGRTFLALSERQALQEDAEAFTHQPAKNRPRPRL